MKKLALAIAALFLMQVYSCLPYYNGDLGVKPPIKKEGKPKLKSSIKERRSFVLNNEITIAIEASISCENDNFSSWASNRKSQLAYCFKKFLTRKHGGGRLLSAIRFSSDDKVDTLQDLDVWPCIDRYMLNNLHKRSPRFVVSINARDESIILPE